MNKTREERFLDIKKSIKTYEDYFFPSSCSNDLETPPIMHLQNQFNELQAQVFNNHNEILRRVEEIEKHIDIWKNPFRKEPTYNVSPSVVPKAPMPEGYFETKSPSTPSVTPALTPFGLEVEFEKWWKSDSPRFASPKDMAKEAFKAGYKLAD